MKQGADVDVMLLDIRMPGKSGLEAVLEASPRPKYPIIAMTGHVDTDAQSDFRYDDFKLNLYDFSLPVGF